MVDASQCPLIIRRICWAWLTTFSTLILHAIWGNRSLTIEAGGFWMENGEEIREPTTSWEDPASPSVPPSLPP